MLAPELALPDKGMKPQIVAELMNYKNQMLPFMPGRRTVDIKTTWSKSWLYIEVGLICNRSMKREPIADRLDNPENCAAQLHRHGLSMYRQLVQRV